MEKELLFTSASILDLLSSIEELQDKDIHLAETDSGVIISIGDSSYNIIDREATDIRVSTDVIEEVDRVTTEAFEDLKDTNDVSIEEIEGGPIKELAKTLLLGGMLRLGSKMLKK